MSEISVGEAADMMKLDKATFLRMENGNTPSAETMYALQVYLFGPNDPRLTKRRRGDRK